MKEINTGHYFDLVCKVHILASLLSTGQPFQDSEWKGILLLSNSKELSNAVFLLVFVKRFFMCVKLLNMTGSCLCGMEQMLLLQALKQGEYILMQILLFILCTFSIKCKISVIHVGIHPITNK